MERKKLWDNISVSTETQQQCKVDAFIADLRISNFQMLRMQIKVLLFSLIKLLFASYIAEG